MPLEITHPQIEIDKITSFIQATFLAQRKTQAVIAVSGGIDSAFSLTVLTKALGADKVTALLLPYGDQPTDLGHQITEFNKISTQRVETINILPMVDHMAQTLEGETMDPLRLGNLKARTRMITVFDRAKKLDALVCGTENKSEHYLGYFTRFGDAASDIEPLCHLYKTQIYQLARHLHLPTTIIDQAPSAGLWPGQTDEAEMGFTYRQADEVLSQLIDDHVPVDQVTLTNGGYDVVEKVVTQVKNMAFKLQVPYQLT